MVTTYDKIILWWLTNRKHKKNFWLDTSLLPWWKKSCIPQVHTSEDILTKMIKTFPLTLNFFWVVYIACLFKNALFVHGNTLSMLYSETRLLIFLLGLRGIPTWEFWSYATSIVMVLFLLILPVAHCSETVRVPITKFTGKLVCIVQYLWHELEEK